MSENQTTVFDHFTGSTSVDYQLDDFLVRPVPKPVGQSFIADYHYTGGVGNASMFWGVYHQPTGRLMGVIAFHTPISENVRASVFEKTSLNEDGDIAVENRCDCDHAISGQDGEYHGYREHVTELHRMAIRPTAPKNTATWFISRALDRLKEYKPKYWAVVSFADQTEGHDGTVYQAANADYYGETGTAVYYEDEDGRLRSPRQCGEQITVEKARARGWTPVEREAKHRYVFWLPDPYESKDDLRERATIDIQPYPE